MTATPLRPPAALVPPRDDIQGAIEFAYDLLITARSPQTPEPTNDSWEALGATILGPALWLAKHHDCPQIVTWLIEAPSPDELTQLWRRLDTACPDLANAQQRMTPYLSRQHPKQQALEATITTALQHKADPND